jgi:hypothetical protein
MRNLRFKTNVSVLWPRKKEIIARHPHDLIISEGDALAIGPGAWNPASKTAITSAKQMLQSGLGGTGCRDFP